VKILSSSWQQHRELQTAGAQSLGPVILLPVREVLAFLAAGILAAAIVLLSVWVAGLDAGGVLSASTWGLGFIFLGVAVDNRRRGACLQLATGAALLLLAWLQSCVSPNFAIVSGVLLAGWAAAGLFQRLR